MLIDQRGSWELAPAYDTLPMIYAPVAGELVEREYDPGALMPSADTLRVWQDARRLPSNFGAGLPQTSEFPGHFARWQSNAPIAWRPLASRPGPVRRNPSFNADCQAN